MTTCPPCGLCRAVRLVHEPVRRRLPERVEGARGEDDGRGAVVVDALADEGDHAGLGEEPPPVVVELLPLVAWDHGRRLDRVPTRIRAPRRRGLPNTRGTRPQVRTALRIN